MIEPSPQPPVVHFSSTQLQQHIEQSELTKTQFRLLVDSIVALGSEPTLEGILRQLVECATRSVSARYGAIGVLGTDKTLKEFIVTGLTEQEQEKIGPLPQGKGVLGLLTAHPQAVRIDDISQHPAACGFPENHPPMGSFLGVPIQIKGKIFGTIYLTEKQDAPGFSSDDQHLISAMAIAAAVAIDNNQLHENQAQLAVLEDRDRIARDLHDLVIQRLFAAGLMLRNIEPDIAAGKISPLSEQRLNQAVNELDFTINDIRATIFELQAKIRGDLLSGIETLVKASKRVLGFIPQLTLKGDISDIPTDIQANILAVIRETLSNVARHAHATQAHVTLAAAETVSLTVRDNGIGIGESIAESGLRNIRARAKELEGWCDISRADDHGTLVEWVVPLSKE